MDAFGALPITPLREVDAEPIRRRPINIGAEQALLGAIFRDNRAHGRVSDFLEAEHFGYAVVQGRSDWVLKPADLAIQEALFAGWAESGALSAALSSDHFAAWLSQRRSHLAVGRSNLRVGHLDIFARPTGVR